jgi:hypothetical protein
MRPRPAQQGTLGQHSSADNCWHALRGWLSHMRSSGQGVLLHVCCKLYVAAAVQHEGHLTKVC